MVIPHKKIQLLRWTQRLYCSPTSSNEQFDLCKALISNHISRLMFSNEPQSCVYMLKYNLTTIKDEIYEQSVRYSIIPLCKGQPLRIILYNTHTCIEYKNLKMIF